jgi:hypothetical protein
MPRQEYRGLQLKDNLRLILRLFKCKSYYSVLFENEVPVN